MSIQPVNKAAERLINSTPVLEKKQKQNKTKQKPKILERMCVIVVSVYARIE